VVGDDEGTAWIHGHSDRPATGLSVRPAEAGDEVNRRTGRAAVAEGHIDYLVADGLLAIPTAMLADEHSVRKLRAHRRRGEVEPECCNVRSEAVVRSNRRGNLFRILWPNAWVHILPPVAVGPAVESVFADG